MRLGDVRNAAGLRFDGALFSLSNRLAGVFTIRLNNKSYATRRERRGSARNWTRPSPLNSMLRIAPRDDEDRAIHPIGWRICELAASCFSSVYRSPRAPRSLTAAFVSGRLATATGAPMRPACDALSHLPTCLCPTRRSRQRPRPAMGLCRDNRLGHAFSLSYRRSRGVWPA